MRVSLLFAWYDMWIGIFFDLEKQKIYVFPIPCIGLVFDWSSRTENCTDLSAVWCPVHGNCSCPDRESEMNDSECPLHSPWSQHSVASKETP